MRFFQQFFYTVLIGIMVTSCANPISKFQILQHQNQAPSSIQFKNLSQKADKYFWDFGDGTTSDAYETEHRYIQSGKYTITLKALKGNKENMTSQEVEITPPHHCMVEIETSLGTMTVQLYDETPQHRDNFIKLVETAYYEGTLFHRVIKGFMVQGGDPNSKNATQDARLGTGGPEYKVPAEFNKNLVHIKGALAAARQGDQVNPTKASSGSQFYIVQGKPVPANQLESLEHQKGIIYSDADKNILMSEGGTPFLDMEYTVFGKVVKGLDVIDKIADSQTNSMDRPLKDVKILSMKVIN
ncbi:MAG: peptidylprolyl isomerase [Saprospiraceae bacterium]